MEKKKKELVNKNWLGNKEREMHEAHEIRDLTQDIGKKKKKTDDVSCASGLETKKKLLINIFLHVFMT